MKRPLWFLAFVMAMACAQTLHAQNEVDALRYTSYGLGGTARSLGAGGAFSAVGADFSAGVLNPAGFALYNRSEIEFTAQINSTNNTAQYLGESATMGRTQFSITNAGYVYTMKPESYTRNKKGFRSVSFAVGFNQTDNYSRAIAAQAFNSQNSISDYFASDARGVKLADISSDYSFGSMAWNLYLIDSNQVDGVYEPSVGGGVLQNISKETVGRKNEWTVSAAGNLNDFLYIGGGVNIVGLRYTQDLVYNESDPNNIWSNTAEDSIPFNDLQFTDYYRTRGTGFNARVGIIIRPTDFLRFGVSVTSPTVHNMSDTYSSGLTVHFDGDPVDYKDELAQGSYKYKLSTPYRVTMGAVFIYKKLGFLSGDFEFSDYYSTKLKSSYSPGTDYYYDFANENQAIQDLFKFNYNFRLGAECRLAEFLRLRAGFAQFGSVLNADGQFYIDQGTGNSAKINASRRFFTGGFGFKQESVYLDLAFVRELNQERQLFYTVADPNEYSPELINHIAKTRILMTIGFPF
jgi:hypothetical protein